MFEMLQSWYVQNREGSVFAESRNWIPDPIKDRYIMLVLTLYHLDIIPELVRLIMEFVAIEDLEYGQDATWTYDYLLDDMEDQLD